MASWFEDEFGFQEGGGFAGVHSNFALAVDDRDGTAVLTSKRNGRSFHIGLFESPVSMLPDAKPSAREHTIHAAHCSHSVGG